MKNLDKTHLAIRIAIDLTPVQPGGINGGAKIMTLQLIKHLAALAPNHFFLLLSTEKNYAELSALQAHNIEVINLTKVSLPEVGINDNNVQTLIKFNLSVLFKIGKLFSPNSLKNRIKPFIQKLQNRLLRSNLVKSNFLKSLNVDLLFCPFTAPFYHIPKLPTVSVIYDLQSHYHPYFFSEKECHERKRHFENACRVASKLICISDFVNQTVLENTKLAPKNVKTIHIRLAHRLHEVAPHNWTHVSEKYALTPGDFLLFPANFWAHKNHEILFTAFSMYRAKFPDSTLKLVCTGADNPRKSYLQEAIKDMGLESWIILPGYLSDEEFSSLLNNCRAVIFPSLYEGFGMPVLEAMAIGKPVLCSNLTSLPEVAGTAALLFDPRKPQEIVDAIYRIESEPELIRQLIARGYERVAEFGTEIDMAKEYLQVFHEVV